MPSPRGQWVTLHACRGRFDAAPVATGPAGSVHTRMLLCIARCLSASAQARAPVQWLSHGCPQAPFPTSPCASPKFALVLRCR